MAMKQLVTLLFFCVSSFTTLAQADSVRVWNKWCAKKDSMLLFTEGNNLIQIYCPGLKPAEIKVRSLDRSLRIGKPEIKGDTLSVLAMPFPEKGKNLRLSVMHARTSKLIKTINFTCDTLPDPVATVGTLRGSDAKRKDILSQMVMRVVFPGSLYSYPYVIRQYTFRISTPKGSAMIPVKGYYIINDILKEISAAPDGTQILFTDIRATCPECATRQLEDIKMKIR